MEKKVNGIVIRAVSYGESDKILTIYTLEEGLVSARIKGVKKAGAKLKACSEPFCFAEFVLASSLNRNVVTGASIYDGFYGLREDVVKFYAGSVVLGFLRVFGLEEADKNLFDFAVNAIKNLTYSDVNPYEETVSFVLSGLKAAGYEINAEGCCRCGDEIENMAFFDMKSGAFVCGDCAEEGDMRVSLSTYKILKEASGSEKTAEFSEEKNKGLIKALKFLSYYIEAKVSEGIKALKELTEL